MLRSPWDEGAPTPGTADDETVPPETVLATLDDADCRDILTAVSDEALSAGELSDRCDLPTSTAYRKLDRLTEAGLVEERLRIRCSGRNSREYVRVVDDVIVSLSDDGDVDVTFASG